MNMTMTIAALFRYPVKGLSPEPLEAVALTPDQTVPGDRRFAILAGSTPFDPLHPVWQPRTAFLTLETHPRLAQLTTRWIAVANTLTVERKGKQVARGDLTSAVGRAVLEEFLKAFLKEGGPSPRIVEAEGFAFTDARQPLVSVISAGSVRDVERVAGRALDHRRFRANVVIEGAAPWAEDAWTGSTLRLGTARLEVVGPIPRCNAINIDPDTGQSDIQISRLLQGGLGRETLGVFARVIEGGEAKVGDGVTVGP